VPTLTTNAEFVNGSFRISTVFEVDSMTKYAKYDGFRGFRGSCRGANAMSWQVYGILEPSLRAGPCVQRSELKENRNVTIKILDINIERPPDTDPTRFR
jgi:hypothetical protein